MNQQSRMDRRELLAATGILATPYLIPSTALAQPGRLGANDRIVLGHIGLGGMGRKHLRDAQEFQKQGKVRIAALCDCDDGKLAEALKSVEAEAKAGEIAVYRDYRHLLGRADIDAVIISTPDHWHAVQTVHACETGKHVYVEKPASVTIEEGRAMVAAARKHRRAVQVGAQGRSGKGAWHTCRAIRNGIVGKVSKVSCWHYPNPEGGFEADSAPPPQLDWDLWVGPLPWRSYNKAYHPGTFRWFLESGGGNIRDRGAHQFSTILWCMNADRQVSFTVEATGAPPTKGLWDNPLTMEVVYKFKDPDWTLVWAQPGDKVGKTEFGNVFWGEHGRLVLEWEGAYRAAEPEAINFKTPAGGFEPYRTNECEDFTMNHEADWMKAIRDPSYRPAVDIEIGHRTATLCNLGNLAWLLGRRLQFDGVKQQVVGDEQANRLLGRPQRHPYHL